MPVVISHTDRPLCLLIPAGPGGPEVTRVVDLLAACAAYADLPLAAVIVNDGNDAAALGQAGRAAGIPTTVRPNARHGQGVWWTGGLDVALVDALRWIANHQPCAAVLRLDSDALVINAFAREVAATFARDASLGMMGNFDSPDGAPLPPGHPHTARLYWRSKRLSYERDLHRPILSLWGWRRRMRLLINRAQRHGYVLGDSCQGGGYALSPGFLQRFAADPFFGRPLDFLRYDFCEDVLMAVAVHALGLRIHYTTGPDRLFNSSWKGLRGAPEVLARSRQAVIHSLKDHGGRKEAETRAYFAARRRALPPPDASLLKTTSSARSPDASAPHAHDPDQNSGGMLAHPPDPGRYDGHDYAADESTGLLGALIPTGARVLDVGCGTGSVTQLLRHHRQARMVGVEPNAERLAIARQRGLEVHAGVLTQELLGTLGRFDVILFADVLEHLSDPAAQLRAVAPSLVPGGTVIASVPNIAHWSVRARLLAGRFDYRPSGLMDATHLRWFTRRTVRELFERAGFTVVTLAGSAGQWMEEYRRVPAGLRRRLLPGLARRFPGLFACQLIVQARPVPT